MRNVAIVVGLLVLAGCEGRVPGEGRWELTQTSAWQCDVGVPSLPAPRVLTTRGDGTAILEMDDGQRATMTWEYWPAEPAQDGYPAKHPVVFLENGSLQDWRNVRAFFILFGGDNNQGRLGMSAERVLNWCECDFTARFDEWPGPDLD